MKHVSEVLREVLRCLLRRKPYSERLAGLRSLERDPRSRYTPPQQEARSNGKRQRT